MSAFKNLFFKDDGEVIPLKETTKPSVIVQPTLNVTDTNTPNIPSQIANVNGTPNEKILHMLMAVLDERNIPGPDYYELSMAAKNLASILPDEATRFKAAFTAMQSTSPTFSKDVVLNSLDSYIKMMETERNNGLKELENNITERVTKVRTSVNDKIQTIGKLQAQIAQIEAQIATESIEVEKVQVEANNAENELKMQANDFNASVDLIVGQLQSDKTKLSQIL